MIVKEENSFEKHNGVTDGWVVIGSKSDPPAAPHGAARLRLKKKQQQEGETRNGLWQVDA